ncbi:uncharacterized protein A1O5_08117 [Cladophialophora psammophila CBS 110553]|uniref:Uncharacterized protein n=1 Tax=Cladophialophora psammophila CBS 110553 TaxID=1182543 RepID=W9WUJ9_9EURO|nr:uncharacterized protein A1O5_08117 [Cladophialophora psammophila CBS 110553]EXJ68326.1 hypothetical protein A1O5_08117 [Cladophialophora psammophila CBS 110553]
MAPRRKTNIVVVHDNNSNDKKALSKPWLIFVLVVSIIAFILAILAAVWPLYLKYKRVRAAKEATNADGEIPPEEDTAINGASTLETPKRKEHLYYESSGYEATPDQNQTLLGNAEGAPITHWDSDSDAVAGVQRPASIASAYTAPPPRYE